jgi:hypothetical protein
MTWLTVLSVAIGLLLIAAAAKVCTGRPSTTNQRGRRLQTARCR